LNAINPDPQINNLQGSLEKTCSSISYFQVAEAGNKVQSQAAAKRNPIRAGRGNCQNPGQRKAGWAPPETWQKTGVMKDREQEQFERY
jgi:hypothetical protein